MTIKFLLPGTITFEDKEGNPVQVSFEPGTTNLEFAGGKYTNAEVVLNEGQVTILGGGGAITLDRVTLRELLPYLTNFDRFGYADPNGGW